MLTAKLNPPYLTLVTGYVTRHLENLDPHSNHLKRILLVRFQSLPSAMQTNGSSKSLVKCASDSMARMSAFQAEYAGSIPAWRTT